MIPVVQITDVTKEFAKPSRSAEPSLPRLSFTTRPRGARPSTSHSITKEQITADITYNTTHHIKMGKLSKLELHNFKV